MPRPFLMTYRDAIDHLVDWCDGLTQEADQRRARAAVQAAYRDTAMASDWSYLQTTGRVPLSAAYETGTVTYLHSTGAHARQLTLSGGLWPSWARYGHLKLSGYDAIYKVAETVSTTVLTLEPTFNPGADIATATSFTLYRSVYTLPGDLVRLNEIHDEVGWSNGYVDNDTYLYLERHIGGASKPFFWTYFGAPDLYGSMALAIYGRPPSAETLDFFYTRTPRAMRLDGYKRYSSDYNAGMVSNVQPATTDVNIAFTANGFDGSQAVGSVLRISADSSAPTGLDGTNPYVAQRILKSVPPGSTSTTWAVDQYWPAITFGAGYSIADPVDLPEYLIDLFLANCELHMARKMQPTRVALASQIARQELLKAMARDAKAPLSEGPMSWKGWKHPAWSFIGGTITPSA